MARMANRFALMLFATLASAAPPAHAGEAPLVVFTVPGRTSATPSIASRGDEVVLVWTAKAGAVTDVYAAASRDAGLTFSHPVRVNDVDGDVDVYGEQPPRVAIGGGGRFAGASPPTPPVYVAWASKRGGLAGVRIAHSTDGGRSFLPAVTLGGPPAAGSRGWESIAASPDGTAHAVWLAAGDSAGHHGGGKAVLYSRWPADDSSPTRIAGGTCECCKTALAVAADGTVYVAWRHVYPGPTRDIAMAVSRDGGRTFSPPARVSDDGWKIDACPDDGPAIAIDGTGLVHVVWPTLVAGDAPAMRLFHATTRDGLAFTRREAIATLGGPHPAHPQLASDGAGGLVVVWDEMSGGVRRAVVSRAPAGPSQRFTAPEVLNPGASGAVYPVVAAIPGGAIAAWTSGPGDRASVVARRIGR
jgi:hypothetical protein